MAWSTRPTQQPRPVSSSSVARCALRLARSGASAGVLYPGWTKTAIAKVGFGGNAIATELVSRAYPGPLGRQVEPERIAKAVVKGIEKRSARIMVPRRWIPVSLLRGIANPLSDTMLERDGEMQRLVGELEAKELQTQAAKAHAAQTPDDAVVCSQPSSSAKPASSCPRTNGLG